MSPHSSSVNSLFLSGLVVATAIYLREHRRIADPELAFKYSYSSDRLGNAIEAGCFSELLAFLKSCN